MTGYQLFAVTAPLIAASVAAGTGVIALKVFTKRRSADTKVKVTDATFLNTGVTAENPAEVHVAAYRVAEATIGEAVEARKSSFRNLVIHEAEALAARIIEGADHLPGTDLPKETIRSK
jgi:hypothetical protein